MLFKHFSYASVRCINSFLGSERQITSEEIHGFAKGKESKSSQPNKVRVILPQNAILSLGDAILANKIHGFVDMLIPPCGFVYVGALPL